MPCVKLMTALLISALAAVPATATLKVWGRGMSMDSGLDWIGGRRPCAGQTALLSDNLAVYLHKQLEARMMVLPSNGEVVFGEGASISFADRVTDTDDRCQKTAGDTVRFGDSGAAWFDAGSWHQAALPSPVPHSERVPCSSGGDEVLFPDNITYRAQVQRPVTVAALTVGPHMMNNDRFRTFRNSSVGRSLFNVRGSFNITGVRRNCETEDCVCGNDKPDVLSAICAATKCPEAPCSGPVQPAGHCCPMCGAFVRVRSSSGRLRRSELENLVGQVGGALASQVRWYVSRTYDRQLQTVMVDAAAESQASRRLAKALLSRLTGTSEYGVTSPVMRASGPRHAALVSGGGGRSAAGPVLAVLCLIGVAGLLVWGVRTKRISLPAADSVHLPPPPSEWHLAQRASALAAQLPSVRRRLASAAAAPFHFARFRNSTYGSEVELGQRVEELQSVGDSASVGTAESVESGAAEESHPRSTAEPPAAGAPPPKPAHSFDNPMFGSKKLDDEIPPTLVAPTSAICVTPDGKAVANPFFGVPVISVGDEGQQGVPAAASVQLTPPEDIESVGTTAQGRSETPPTAAEDGVPVQHGKGQEPQEQERQEQGQKDDQEMLITVEDSD